MPFSCAAKGFTLVEILLVMVVISTIIVMGLQYTQQKTLAMQIDRTVYQMQYIMNAGLAYYVANGKWPGVVATQYKTCATGTGCSAATNPLAPNFLPKEVVNVIGKIAGVSGSYVYGYTTTGTSLIGGGLGVPAGNFQVIGYFGSTPTAKAKGMVVAGKIPFAYYDETNNAVVGYVNIPGQNLNNASAINFAGLYHHGGCVPVPSCPINPATGAPLTPQVFVLPVSVSGVNDVDVDSGSTNIYPISSFTAYAIAPDTIPGACRAGGSAADACTPIQGNAPVTGKYWRACLQVITEKGNVAVTRSDKWGADVTLAAFTRCAINNEPAGSTFSVYTN
ncbi:MAG: hypothetical protein A3F43_03615 [Gammaproteobacteria bacterium RIFCSPHIGHO2_12_FULL_42_10]|nr:MAG: hypothetical protein A3F43_03615 [Gammaproteobacteria bacterium RIFCSPHIGHO2_12_FULL_42_10]